MDELDIHLVDRRQRTVGSTRPSWTRQLVTADGGTRMAFEKREFVVESGCCAAMKRKPVYDRVLECGLDHGGFVGVAASMASFLFKTPVTWK